MKVAQIKDVLIRRWRPFAVAFLVAAIVLNAIAVLVVPTEYAAESSVLMAAGGDHDTPSDATSATKPILSADLPYLATTATVLANVARDIGWPRDPRALLRLMHHIKANLSAPPAGAIALAPGAIVVIRFTGLSSADSAAGANAVAEEMTRFYHDRATERFSVLTADLQQQVNARRARINRVDSEIQRLTAAAPYLATHDDTHSLSAEYQTLAQERAEVEATAKGEAAAAAVTSRRPAEAELAARRQITESDPAYRDVADQFGHDFARLATVQAEYSGAYPGLPELRHTVAGERQAVQGRRSALQQKPPALDTGYAAALGEVTRAQSLAAGDAAKLEGLNQVLGQTQDQLNAGKLLASRFDDLQRERDVQTSAYGVLSARLAEARADQAQAGSIGSVSVLDRAAYGKPVFYTVLPVRIGLALLLALCIAFATIFWLDRREYRMWSVTIVENVYGAPIVATLN
jgi:hypothetical protein